jgi:hypothetical protein
MDINRLLFKESDESLSRKFDRDFSLDPHNTDTRDVDRRL